jgi:hypothetical protein
MSPTELRAVQDWYQATLGEIPPHVKFLAAHRPDLLKAYRQRFETCVRELPKQIVPTTLLHYHVIRGFASGIRDNVVLARAFGVSKQLVLNTIGSASLTGIEGFDLVDDAAGDIFATPLTRLLPYERGVLPGRAITTPRSPVRRSAGGGTGGTGV